MAQPLARLGFIGTGAIASAVVEGYSRLSEPFPVRVSPRNEVKSRRLAERWANVERCDNNQAVVDGSDVVFIALRPGVAEEVVRSLRFRPDQTVVSFIPLVGIERMRAWVGPAARVFKALPLAPVARHLGQVPYFPQDAAAEALLSPLAPPLPTESEAELQRLWAITGLISLFYAVMEATHGWCVEGGVRPEVAHAYTTAMYASLARMAEDGTPFEALSREAATPGGLNEMALAMMRQGSLFPDFREALEAILARFEPASTGRS